MSGMVSEIGKTVQRGFWVPRLNRLRIECHVESSRFVEVGKRVWPRSQRSLRIIPHPTDVPAHRLTKGISSRQIPPMSRPSPFLSNFDAARFVAQFLPITPQLVILALLDARTGVARLKTQLGHAFEPFACVANWPKIADCVADTTCTG